MTFLAQVNVALMRTGLDDPEMGDFVAALDPMYRTAEASPGFVWRLRDPDGRHRPSTSGQVNNVSVWPTYERSASAAGSTSQAVR